ncbi:hypothetical protein FQZ97_810250 [compost metagenome]
MAASSMAGTAWIACALATICFRSPSLSDCSTYTAARDSKAELTSNDGFSVVAPMKVKRPDSTCGRNASCWLLLKRCTSSTKTMVRCCVSPSRAAVACSTASRMSFTPPSTALMLRNCASKASAMSRAMVVLPVPGGPQRMQECGWPDSKAMRSDMPGPSRCCWPITSPSVLGRRRSARGWWVRGAKPGTVLLWVITA